MCKHNSSLFIKLKPRFRLSTQIWNFIMKHFILCKSILAVLLVTIVMIVINCKNNDDKEKPKEIAVTGVTLDETLTIVVGDVKLLIAKVTPEDAANLNVGWSSSNEGIVFVDNSGQVTAKEVGTAEIAVITEDGGKVATCIVTVIADAISVTGITLNKSTLTLQAGKSESLVETIIPEDASNKKVSWSSDNKTVVDVDDAGLVTAKTAGEATITVTTEDGGFQAACQVIVEEVQYSLYRPIKGFLKTDGNIFIDETGREIAIRGMGNIYTEQDFKNMASIGFNNVRYYLFAKDYEVNNGAAYNWAKLNDAIAWAKKYNLTLVLAMMDRPGTNSPEFFTNQSYQTRLVNFWRALADRYKNETAISAYGLMNEPPIAVDNPGNAAYNCGNNQNGHHPSQCGNNGKTRFQQHFDQYQQAIQRIVDAIREVDMNHTVIAERLWLEGGHFSFGPNDQRDCWQNFDGKYNFPDINDPANNYAYEYHCYEPGQYVHQSANFNCWQGDCCTNCDRAYPSSTVAKWNVSNPASNQSWTMTKSFLDYEYTVPLNYARNVKNVPVYIGEWGIHIANFKNNSKGENRGGRQYVLDLVDVFTTYGLSNSFHPYFMAEVNPVMDQNLEAAFRAAFGIQK